MTASTEDIEQTRNQIAKTLEKLARDIRSGEVVVTDMSQSWPVDRRSAHGVTEFFRTQDLEMTIKYKNVEQQESEQIRLAAFMAEHPYAES